jgi:hypothetical protein
MLKQFPWLIYGVTLPGGLDCPHRSKRDVGDLRELRPRLASGLGRD